jgi:hypothetical protein
MQLAFIGLGIDDAPFPVSIRDVMTTRVRAIVWILTSLSLGLTIWGLFLQLERAWAIP